MYEYCGTCFDNTGAKTRLNIGTCWKHGKVNKILTKENFCEVCEGRGQIDVMSASDNMEHYQQTCDECDGSGLKEKLPEEMNLMVNKYYVGAKHLASAIGKGVNGSGTHRNEEDALNEAKRQVSEGEVEIALVVEIKYIVRRDRPPVTVERV
jgi:RecJ-like exonuclease